MAEDPVTYIYLIVVLIIGLRSLYTFATFSSTFWWLKRQRVKTVENTDKHFVVVIPVLREQRVLRETVEWFLSLDYPRDKLTIAIVTTEQEYTTRADGQTTVELAALLHDEYGHAVWHIHYPETRGEKVHQLNYAISVILEEDALADSEMFIALYDADSRPHPQTLKWVSTLSVANRRQQILQQSAIFLQNFSDMKSRNGFIVAKLLQANAILQTRWTLAHEIPRILRQGYALRRWNRRLFLSHCVGHGLFLRKDVMRELRRLPTETLTEDLFMGFVLSLLREPIQLVPVFESADMPYSLKSALLQKYVWFYGPMEHRTYASVFLQTNPERAPKWLVNLFAVRGLIPAAAWLTSGWMVLFVIGFTAFSGTTGTIILSASTLIAYLSTFGLTIQRYALLNEITGRREVVRTGEGILVFLFLIPIFVLHSLPPLLSVTTKIRSLVTSIRPFKPKTER
ncbi:MAG: hypothetical protein COU90_00680 [Candidatus Ryanbacteria bacterium CG10_big_fil_rev_8_21_14_0_10_43_42]|uniref:Glycosyltransferase 2-like domain-containing protein n=1 Tax=Candidatus Ryanbacteria bacterium CG10_big_fil_rev_8_21_14_0_10_43_42 TaxID=1974864 RepID=A0A2M8KXV9_9BACT|nr:MAG: hypothetical protein COU90_00680 [Candidatus Ryanbacteria bacterium CG10_big_fil_rev_8_21_14_0_10_43_42]